MARVRKWQAIIRKLRLMGETMEVVNPHNGFQPSSSSENVHLLGCSTVEPGDSPACQIPSRLAGLDGGSRDAKDALILRSLSRKQAHIDARRRQQVRKQQQVDNSPALHFKSSGPFLLVSFRYRIDEVHIRILSGAMLVQEIVVVVTGSCDTPKDGKWH